MTPLLEDAITATEEEGMTGEAEETGEITATELGAETAI